MSLKLTIKKKLKSINVAIGMFQPVLFGPDA